LARAVCGAIGEREKVPIGTVTHLIAVRSISFSGPRIEWTQWSIGGREGGINQSVKEKSRTILFGPNRKKGHRCGSETFRREIGYDTRS